MHQSGNYIFNRPVQRARANVQFVPGSFAALPCLGNRYMTIGFGRALNRDNRLFQLAIKISGIDCPENLFKVSCGSASFDGFFHGVILAFVFLE